MEWNTHTGVLNAWMSGAAAIPLATRPEPIPLYAMPVGSKNSNDFADVSYAFPPSGGDIRTNSMINQIHAGDCIDVMKTWPANFVDTIITDPPYGLEKASVSTNTVKPLDLMKCLCLLTKTPTGGIVLDPFCGSGTTLWAAEYNNRPWIGIEMNPEYVAIANARIANERAQMKMAI